MTNKYPYTDFNEFNLDWVIRSMRDLKKDWNDFKITNSLKYAGAWDITEQYEAYTLVEDDNKVYMSLKPVPAGISLSNTEYWELIEDYGIILQILRQKTDGFVTPEMFGAAGDGVTDDTAAFQDAADTGKTILLTGDYLIGEISAQDIHIIGCSDNRIINKENDVLFNASGSFKGKDFMIINPEIFDYIQSSLPYGTIDAKHAVCENISMVNINSCGVRITGNCIVHNCIFDNENFDVRTIYDGSLDNHSFGVYVYQTSDTSIIDVRDSEFYSFIEGVYIGTYADKAVAAVIDNNIFNTIGDHAVYCNSYADRVRCTFSNNYCENIGTTFSLVGNNHIIENNYFKGAFDGTRSTFGFSIRNGSHIYVKNNIFESGTFSSVAGSGANCLIFSSDSSSYPVDDIVFENNTFSSDDLTATVPWLRIGQSGQNIGTIRFKNNILNIKGGNYGFYQISGNDLILEDNKIYFNQNPFIATSTYNVTVLNNYIENLSTSGIFHISSKGTYKHNTFNTNATPLRRDTDSTFDVGYNRQLNGTLGVYNLIGSGTGTTNLKFTDLDTGSFVSPSSGHAELRNTNVINPAFHNGLLVYDSLGNPESFTITSVAGGIIYLDIPAGTHYYTLT